MDLRAPLHHVKDGGDEKINSRSKIQHNVEGAPWVLSSSPSSSTVDSSSYERIIHQHLCRMYVASQAMELGSDSRFSGLVLFHRYVRRFYGLVQQQPQQQQQTLQGKEGRQLCITQEMKQIKTHLGTVAAACLFLGCKMEEEPRRIRDVINLAHLLNFSSWEEEDNIKDDDAISSSSDTKDQQKLKSLEKHIPPIITIVESPHPPPLDEKYWTSKEQMISTEQHVLRMIQFDTTVCHPHRCVLIIMETLGFGVGKCHSGKYDDEHNNKNDGNSNWLLNSDQSEHVILQAWKLLNEVPLDPRGIVLQFPVMVLSCAAISLAAAGGGDAIESNGKEKDNGKEVDLPDFWWRALDVPTKDMMMARDMLCKK